MKNKSEDRRATEQKNSAEEQKCRRAEVQKSNRTVEQKLNYGKNFSLLKLLRFRSSAPLLYVS